MKLYKNFYFPVIMLAAAILTGCAAQTNLHPIGKGNTEVNVSFGGPIITAFGNNLPIPYLITGIQYGFSDHVNLTANCHLLPLFYGIAGFDGGISYFPISNKGWRPSIGIQQRVMMFGSLRANVDTRFRAYPISSVTCEWVLQQRHYYTGVDLVPVLFDSEYDNEAPKIVTSLYLGYGWKLSAKTAMQIELKWQGTNIRSDQLAVNYTSIKRKGAVTPLISYVRRY